MFKKRSKYEEDSFDYVELDETEGVQPEPEDLPPVAEPVVKPVKPNIVDSIITKIHTTYEELKDLSYQSEELMDDSAKADIVAYQTINQKILSKIGYIKGLVEILNESNYVSGDIKEMTADQKVIARFTSEFEGLIKLLAKNDELIQSVSTPSTKTAGSASATASGKAMQEDLNGRGYQGLHRDIASRIGYMDALLEILTDNLGPAVDYSEEFNTTLQ